MIPTSRIYRLVKEWSQKPKRVIKEGFQPNPDLHQVAQSEQLKAWQRAQHAHYQAALNPKTQLIHYVIHQVSGLASDDQIRKITYEAILACEYWHASAKPHHLILPIKTGQILQQDFQEFLQGKLLHCHLPLGYLGIGLIQATAEDQEGLLQQAIIQLRRLGILIYLFEFEGLPIQLKLLETGCISAIQMIAAHWRDIPKNPGRLSSLKELTRIAKEYELPIICGGIDLIKDRDWAEQLKADHLYGKIIKPAMTASQIARLFTIPSTHTTIVEKP
jgi:EAL domain-containing protein (putative c-di-GMP-specific phosphodiesterase class I)